MGRRLATFIFISMGWISMVWAQPPQFIYPPSGERFPGYNANGRAQINGVNASANDYVAVFDGSLVCFGFDQLSGSANFAISTVVDDPNIGTDAGIDCINVGTPPFGPYTNCETFTLFLWQASSGDFYQYTSGMVAVEFNYLDGNADFKVDGFLNSSSVYNFTQVNNILPVQLLNFQGKVNGRTVQLEWATLNEINNAHFEIQHSTDGRIFETIGQEKGAGNFQGFLEYQFVDENPAIGINYYRLKQVDFDGQFEYSKVVSVSLDRKGGSDMEVFPNPAGTFAELLLPEGLSEVETTITVHDNAGREVLRRKEQPNVLVRLPLDGIPAGFYTLTVRGGNEVISKPLVVQ